MSIAVYGFLITKKGTGTMVLPMHLYGLYFQAVGIGATRYDKLGASFFAFVKLPPCEFGCDQLSLRPSLMREGQVT